MQRNFEIFDLMILEEKAAWWEMSLPSGKVWFGDAKSTMLGYIESDFDTYHDFVKLVHEDDSENAMNAMRDALEGNKEYYEALYRIKTKDGQYLRFFDIGKVVDRNGEEMKITGLVFKITEDKQIEEFKSLVKSGETNLVDLIGRSKRL